MIAVHTVTDFDDVVRVPRGCYRTILFGFSNCFARSGTRDVIRVLRDSYPRLLGTSRAEATAIGPGLGETSTVRTLDPSPAVIRLTYKTRRRSKYD